MYLVSQRLAQICPCRTSTGWANVKVMTGACWMPIMEEAEEDAVAWLMKIGCCAPVAMIRFCGMAGALEMCDGVGGAWGEIQ